MMIRLPPVLHGGQAVDRSLCQFRLFLQFVMGHQDLLSDAHRRRGVPRFPRVPPGALQGRLGDKRRLVFTCPA
jgi:hypothetical protein